MNIDKPLGDGPRRGKSFRRGRGGRPSDGQVGVTAGGTGPMRNARVKTASVQTAFQSPLAQIPGNALLPQGASSKIIVSNLPEDVTEQQLRVSKKHQGNAP